MNSIVTVHDSQYAPQSNSNGCTNCDFYKNKCIYPGLDCVGEIYHLIHKEGDIVTINGKQYQAQKCASGCNGCDFYEDKSAYYCPVHDQVGCYGVIYNLIGEPKKENLYVDLTWLKGTVRTVVSEAIQKKAVVKGWRWPSEDAVLPGNTDGWLLLAADKGIELWDSDPSLCGGRKLRELSVNNALDGNYDNPDAAEEHGVKEGDAVFSKGRFHTVAFMRGTMVHWKGNPEMIYTDDYKQCRERKSFRFHEGQRVCWLEAKEYYTFLRYTSTTAECYNGQHNVVHVDPKHLVPASLKERYEVAE